MPFASEALAFLESWRGRVCPHSSDPSMARSWAKVSDGLASALDQCLGGLPYLPFQKPDASSLCICLEDFQLEGQGGLPASRSPIVTPFPGCCRGWEGVPSSPRV